MGRKKYVVIMAAGSGTRMGAQLPKQFLELDGKVILRRTIEVFQEACPDVSVITVLPKQYLDYWKDYCYKNSFICPQVLVPGGITRFHSVKNALKKVPAGALVAVHDGVRPLLTVQMIRDMYEKAENTPALIPVIPCVDTMKVLEKKVSGDGSESLSAMPGQVVDRSVLYGAQTPQIFHSEILKDAYNQAFDTAFTDDASVVEKYGKSLSFVIGERLNIKITTAEDLTLAEAVLKIRNS
jgi:2-C-methyl-D-erythritol 4-phosphate cytidylyltransferase